MNKSERLTLKAGIFAAGRGERLRAKSPFKPLVKVDGRTLIERVLYSMAEAAASEVAVIINKDSLIVRDHVTASAWPFSLHWIVETTPSSMHSFLRLVETLAADGDEGPFLLSTVDTVAGPKTYRRFIAEARQDKQAVVVLALTSPGDDEKPLLVRCAPEDGRVIAIDEAATPSDHATAGVYAVRSSVLREADQARRDKLTALRLFFARLLNRGYRLSGVPIGRSIDVDQSADIEKANNFLKVGAI
jgi:NDP-sugar pyrophosphorylase family protein